MKHVRKGLNCSLCNWHFHKHINLELKTLTLKKSFCEKLKKKFMPIWLDKYLHIMNLAMILDEYLFLTSHKRFVKYQSDRGQMHKYILLMKDCKKNLEGKLCKSVCTNFTLNKFNYLFDGEGGFIENFIKEYRKHGHKLQNLNSAKKLFNSRRKSKIKNAFRRFVKNYTVLGDKIVPRRKGN